MKGTGRNDGGGNTAKREERGLDVQRVKIYQLFTMDVLVRDCRQVLIIVS